MDKRIMEDKVENNKEKREAELDSLLDKNKLLVAVKRWEDGIGVACSTNDKRTAAETYFCLRELCERLDRKAEGEFSKAMKYSIEAAGILKVRLGNGEKMSKELVEEIGEQVKSKKASKPERVAYIG